MNTKEYLEEVAKLREARKKLDNEYIASYPVKHGDIVKHRVGNYSCLYKVEELYVDLKGVLRLGRAYTEYKDIFSGEKRWSKYPVAVGTPMEELDIVSIQENNLPTSENEEIIL